MSDADTFTPDTPPPHATRSLASLAGERDRALRSLAAEEDKRHELVEKLCSLLGEELTCGDVSRLLMGLERIEEEKEGGQEEDGERYGRAWVLEVSCSLSGPITVFCLSGVVVLGA